MERKRTNGRRPRKAEPARKVERKIALPDDLWRLLDQHAVQLRVRPVAVIAGLIDAHCRRFVVSDRGKNPEKTPGLLLEEGDAPAAGQGTAQPADADADGVAGAA